jgi:hypothetical protein
MATGRPPVARDSMGLITRVASAAVAPVGDLLDLSRVKHPRD